MVGGAEGVVMPAVKKFDRARQVVEAALELWRDPARYRPGPSHEVVDGAWPIMAGLWKTFHEQRPVDHRPWVAAQARVQQALQARGYELGMHTRVPGVPHAEIVAVLEEMLGLPRLAG